MSKRRVYWCVGGTTLVLLVASPILNLRYLADCFADPRGAMDVPRSELQLEVRLLLLQAYLAVVGAIALPVAARESRAARIGGGIAWALVAAGGILWDKWLDHFRGEGLPPHSVYACVLEGRSGHTHSLLSNAPFLLSATLALWVLWLSLRAS